MLENNKIIDSSQDFEENIITDQDFEKKRKHNKYQKQYYRKNHDKMTEYYRKYREKNREKIREAVRKYKKKKRLLARESKIKKCEA